jgi:hypothetical protein
MSSVPIFDLNHPKIRVYSPLARDSGIHSRLGIGQDYVPLLPVFKQMIVSLKKLRLPV